MKSILSKIKLLALDVDGVLTSGKVIYDSDGREIKIFDVQDGHGIIQARKVGLTVALITARDSRTVTIRAKELGIEKVYQGASPKITAYEKMLADLGIKDSEVCFVGDDILDIPVLRRVGFAVAVKNAVPETKAVADYVTKRSGGDGAVREVIELILKAQGKWQKILKSL